MAEEKKERVRQGMEDPPISSPLKVVDYRTLSKGFGWWAAVVLVESWGRQQLSLYLWQKKDNGWKRKQKFTIHDAEKWEQIVTAVNQLIDGLK